MRSTLDFFFLAATLTSIMTSAVSALPLESNGRMTGSKVAKTRELSARDTGRTPLSSFDELAFDLPFDNTTNLVSMLGDVETSIVGMMLSAGMLVSLGDGESADLFNQDVQAFSDTSGLVIQLAESTTFTEDINTVEVGFGGSGLNMNKRDSPGCMQLVNKLLSQVTQFIGTCGDVTRLLSNEVGVISFGDIIFPLCECDSSQCLCTSGDVNITVDSATLVGIQDLLVNQAVESINESVNMGLDSINSFLDDFVHERSVIIGTAQLLVEACT